jgi:hypothetical protein
MSNGSLTLHPKDPNTSPATAAELVRLLDSIGLLGAPLDPGNAVFRVGDRFLQLISFLGCSPYLRLEPPEDGSDNFCHILVRGPFDRPRLLYGEGTRAPRCPACGAALTGWRAQAGSQVIGCSACGAKHPPDRITWGKHAGHGRLFVEIRNIFPGEAVPVDELLSRLGELDCGEWGYFYLQGKQEIS